ncbi:MAG: DUF5362 family protein [Flavobacteriales bacterium]
MNDNLLDDNHNSDNSGITNNMKASMRATAPWMKFLGILFIVIGGIYSIISILAILGSPLGGLLSLAFSALYIYMGYLIFKSGSDYSSYVGNSNTATLESALKNQKMWWTITGIMTAVVIVITIAALIFGGSMINELGGGRFPR